MGIFDNIFKRNSSEKESPNKLSSYRQAAELICKCWDMLDMSYVAPYLDENVIWEGGCRIRLSMGKGNY